MIRNYLIIAWRNLVRHKIYSAINITGLAIGLAVCMLIMLYVGHESSYDKFHANANRIFWMQGKIKIGADSVFMPRMSYAAAPIMKSADPSVESFLRFKTSEKKIIVSNPESPSIKFQEDNFLFADSNFFSFFSFRLLKGNKNTVLKEPFTVVISPAMGEKYFGTNNPVGKTISYNGKHNFVITGVAEKTPSNSSINYDFVASLSSLSSIDGQKELITSSQTVQLGSFATYFLLRSPGDAHKLEAGLQKLNSASGKNNEVNERYIATPFTSTHLKANYGDASNTKYLKVFPFVAALILLLALTNYMSLSTARSAMRAKEIGVRKVMGANRGKIATQFFIESALYTAIAFSLGYLLCINFQPYFFSFLQMEVDKSFLYQPFILTLFALLFIVTVILAATYPSILLSAYKPVAVLYGKLSKQRGSITIRKFFTVFQFTISVMLITCGIVIGTQMNFFKNKNTGVSRENILMVPFAPTIGKNYSSFKQEAASLAGIQQVSTANYSMYKGYDMFFTTIKNVDILLPVLSVDENFIPLLNLQWKIKPEDPLYYNKQDIIVANETALRKLDVYPDPVGKKVDISGDKHEIAGVLKDFNYSSLHNKIDALCLFVSKDTSSAWGQIGGCFFAKIKPNVNIPSLVAQLKTIYKKYDNEKPFEYSFMDEAYAEMYKAEDRLSKMLNAFTLITVLIACLGLFGLVTYTAQQRTKEIGIRKVLGASAASVVSMLSKDFLKLVVLSIIIASPIAWYIMNNWLRDFEYRISISWWMFIAASGLAIIIAFITISFQAIKAALSNPVKSLRTE